MESYIQYASGYQKDNIIFDDIKKAISDVQKMDDEHGAFWASVITDDENVIETNKDLQLSIIFDGEPNTRQMIGMKSHLFTVYYWIKDLTK